MEGQSTLDMSDFDFRQHAEVLLDGVGDAFLLHANREVLQGRAKKGKGGQSATMVYAYPLTLARRAVVATFDLSATHLACEEGGGGLGGVAVPAEVKAKARDEENIRMFVFLWKNGPRPNRL